MTTRCALYLRVSTDEQSTEMQTRDLREYCARRGWEIVAVYEDIGISGTIDSRPRLNQLMADAHKRLFDIVCVWRFDRLARSVSHLLRALETFQQLGIEFCSFSEAIDTATPVGRMTLTVLGAVAELERNIITERVRAGQRNARAAGRHMGRPRARLDANEVQNLLAAGHNMKQIGSLLGVSASTICRRRAQQAW
jgi:DNA invertase Pin-like site-specific DNA recombinase